MRLSGPAPMEHGVVAPEEFDDRAQNRIAHEICGKDLAIEFAPRKEPGQQKVQGNVQQCFVNLCWMNTCPARFVVLWEMDRPWHAGCETVAATIHQASNAADRVSERNSGRHHIAEL